MRLSRDKSGEGNTNPRNPKERLLFFHKKLKKKSQKGKAILGHLKNSTGSIE